MFVVTKWGGNVILDLKSVFISEGATLPVKFELDMSDMAFGGINPITKPVAVSGSVYNRAGIVTVDVLCEVEFSAPCDRCGKNATKNHGINIKRVLVSQLADKTDDEIIEVPDLQLDVSELAVTEIVLSLPMKHLCKEDCKGICQTCGKDLNDGPCDCNHAQVDPRLEVLAQLLKD